MSWPRLPILRLLIPCGLLLAAPARAAQVQYVTAASLNVRAGPGTGYRILGALQRGDRVSVVATDGRWRRFSYEGRAAWVHGDYLESRTSASSGTSGRPRSRAGLIQLPAAGPGFYSYTTSSRRWGTPRMIYGLERVARRWRARGMPRMGVGDISNTNGGTMSGHPYSHKTGKDADVRPVRRSGEGRVTIAQAAYSRARTRSLFALVMDELPVQLIAFNDPQLYRPLRKVIYAAGHDNHFHVRIP